MKSPASYARTYENPEREPIDLNMIQTICRVLNVPEGMIFDDYMKFLASGYQTKLVLLKGRLGLTNPQMDQRIGTAKGNFRKWVSGEMKPGRKSYQKIRKVMEEAGMQ